MPDTPTPSLPADPSHAHDALTSRLAALETALDDVRDEATQSRDHRTRVTAYGALVAAVGGLVVVGAISARDITLSTSGRVDALGARVERVEAAASRKDLDDRTTRDAIVRLQSTLEALQSTVVTRLDSIDQHLPTRAPSR